MKVKPLFEVRPEDLRDTVNHIRRALYFNENTSTWDLDKEVNGADFIERVSQILDLCGLTPKED